jgi:hypothetical protein
MNKVIRSALIAAALLTGASAAIAQTVPDESDQYSGYYPDEYNGYYPDDGYSNSLEANRDFWDEQSRGGGGAGR